MNDCMRHPEDHIWVGSRALVWSREERRKREKRRRRRSRVKGRDRERGSERRIESEKERETERGGAENERRKERVGIGGAKSMYYSLSPPRH